MSQDRNTNRFRRQPPVADRVARLSQTRLVVLIGSFLIVLAMMQQARKPSTWRWMWQMNNPGVPVEVDPRLKPESSAGQTAGSFLSPREDEPGEGDEQDEAGLTIDSERLADILDDTYFRPAEKDIWFYLLSRLRNASSEALEQESLGAVSTLQLYRQPDSYRGKLVDIRGTVRRAHRLIAPQNERGIEAYWQLWLFEEDGLTAPCVVYALQVPSEFPEGMSVEAQVELTGYSYKRWAYQGGEGDLMVAPVVLAKNLQWLRARETPPSSVSWEQVFWPLVLALALSLVVIRWILIWPGRSRRRVVTRADAEDRPANFDFLDERDDNGGS